MFNLFKDMTRLHITLICAFMAACVTSCDIFQSGKHDADEIVFNDENFLKALQVVQHVNTSVGGYEFEFLQDVDYNRDGKITFEEAGKVVGLALWDTNLGTSFSIQDLSGIEYFTSLEYLFCQNNVITNLDVSKNEKLEVLDCSNNSITNLDVSNCMMIMHLICCNNSLESLRFGNTGLCTLNCSNNNLASLDFTESCSFQNLYCSNNRLTELDLSEMFFLNDFWCDGNNITTLDLSGSPSLEYLDCSNNPISELDLSMNSNLETLNCSNTNLLTLDLRKNDKMKKLYCSGITGLQKILLANNCDLNQSSIDAIIAEYGNIIEYKYPE